MQSVAAETSDWNVVVTLPEQTFQEACRLLRQWGKVRRTGFYNVLGVVVEEPRRFLEDFAASVRREPGLLNFVSHVVPSEQVFDFRDQAEFAAQAREVVLGWLPRLAGKSFKVRLHRRGFKGIVRSHDEERLLADVVLSQLATAGAPGRADLDDPDCVIQIETIGGRAGLSLWTRQERQRFPFLGTD